MKLYLAWARSAHQRPAGGDGRTNANGEWVMNGAFFAAVYYAQVLALVVHVNDSTYHCGIDLSVRMHY